VTETPRLSSTPDPPRPLPMVNVAGTLRSPPAIWAAMVRQGQWKSWALVLAFALCALEALVALRLARKEPDIVLIAPDGQSTYLSPSVAGEALLHFLREQRQLPSDVTVFHFTRDFVQYFFALDAASADVAFAAALTMMAPGFRARIAQEAEDAKLLEEVRASRTRAELTFEALDILERTEGAFHVRAVLRRRTERLEDGALISVERLQVDLYESVVPRSAAHADGLVVGQLSSHALAPADSLHPADANAPAAQSPSPSKAPAHVP